MKTIRGRITFWAILVLLLSIAIVSVVDIALLGGKNMETMSAELAEETENDAEVINSVFQRSAGQLESFAAAVVATGGDDDAAVKKIIDSIYTQNPEYQNVYYGKEDGIFIGANNGGKLPSNYDPRERDWYKNAVINGRLTITNPYMAASQKEMCSTISIPILINGNLKGVVGIDVSLQSIIGTINNIEYKTDAYAFLVDATGNIVTHPNEEFLPSENGSFSIMEVLPELNQLIVNPGKEIIRIKNYEGEETFFASAEVKATEWIICVAVPRRVVFKEVFIAVNLSIAIALTSAIISLVACLILIKKEFEPITKMLPAVKRIAEGDFSTPLDFSLRDDELGKLQNELSNLVGIVNDIIAQQKYILSEVSNGDLTVADMDEMPGEFNDIAESVNSIKTTLNALITEIQLSALNVQSTAMGLAGVTDDKEQLLAAYEALSIEANELMDKANMFKTTLK